MVLALLALENRALAVSFEVSPGDEVYAVLEELAAVGAVQSELWGIKPFSEAEVARLLTEAKHSKKDLSPYLQARLKDLLPRFVSRSKQEGFLKPLEDPYLFYVHTAHALPWENWQGRTLGQDNLGLGFQSKGSISSHLLFHATFEATYLWDRPQGQDFARGRFLQAYAKAGRNNLFLTFGVHQIWWGQAQTGNLLFSLNAPPFANLWELGLEQPVLLPWVFRLLGPFKFDLFAAHLSDERVVPHPWLFGLKVAFKPHPRLEIDLTRSIMCGGENRQVSLSKVLFGIGENVEGGPDPAEGDQKAGFEIRFRPVDHLVLYTEAAGEDEAGGLPSRWAYIWGLYAPGLWQRVGLRVEYAYITKWWYHHHVYRSGYTYKGWLMGYYTDRTTRNYFLELTYDLNANWRLGLASWQEKHYDAQVQYLYKVKRYELSLTGHVALASKKLLLQSKVRLNDMEDASPLPDGPQILFKVSLPF